MALAERPFYVHFIEFQLLLHNIFKNFYNDFKLFLDFTETEVSHFGNIFLRFTFDYVLELGHTKCLLYSLIQAICSAQFVLYSQSVAISLFGNFDPAHRKHMLFSSNVNRWRQRLP